MAKARSGCGPELAMRGSAQLAAERRSTHSLRLTITLARGEKPLVADTRDGFSRYSELVGWSADGQKLYFTEIQGTILKVPRPASAGLTCGDQSGGRDDLGRRFPECPANQVRVWLGDVKPAARSLYQRRGAFCTGPDRPGEQ